MTLPSSSPRDSWFSRARAAHAQSVGTPSAAGSRLAASPGAWSTRTKLAWVAIGLFTLALWAWAGPAASQTADPQDPATTATIAPITPVAPEGTATSSPPTTTGDGPFDGIAGPAEEGTAGDGSEDLTVNVDLGGADGETDPTKVPSRTVTIILGLTVLAVAPSILIMMTSFTRIIVVLSLTRNALGVQSIPPNQVLVGLAMFLTFFVMAPVLTQINDDALQPYMDGEITQSQALHEAEGPIKDFMLANTRTSDLDMMVSMQGGERPETPEDTSLVAVVPAFVLSELQSAFIIGIVLFVPFVVLDLVVSAVLMSLGMMMLPPVFISLPLKLLVFVMVDGWALTVSALVGNYKGVPSG